ncbi:MAG TPA: amidohydrolase family protein [Longimicrobiales bacterium]|nr:amidohydrolase family protein [Longimicrobiales bacterium]
MKRLLVICAALGAATAPGLRGLAAQQATVAFVDVSVVPMDAERVLEHQTVVVQNGKITALGPAAQVPVPANATRVDGRGKYLVPGLTEMHGHLTQPNAPYSPETVLFLYVAGGVTTVRGMQGHPSHLELRRRVEAGELIGPRLFLSSPPMSGNNTTNPDTAAQRVRAAKQAGYDHIKVHENLTREVYSAIARTGREVGMPWAGHVSSFVGVTGALEEKQATIDHLDDYVEAIENNPVNIPAIAQKTKAAGVAVVPTMPLWEVLRGLHAPETMKDRTELQYVPAQMRQNWANQVATMHSQANQQAARAEINLRNQLLKGLSDAGVLILLGSDAPQLYSVPGFSLQREMETMVAAGMTPYQVLQSGTANVARFYKLESEAGTVAVGKRADVLLVDGNPLADITNMARKAGVMVRGRWLPWPEIQTRLDQISAQYK